MKTARNATTCPTLLVVDDRADNRWVIRQVLEDGIPGLKIIEAGSADEALILAKVESPTAALIDMQMPLTDGGELCRKLKELGDEFTVPSLMLITSHRTTSELRANALDAGADDFIQRPFENLEFVARIRVMLRLRAAEDELRLAKESLERRVIERTEELRSAKAYAECIVDSMMESLIVVSEQDVIERVNHATTSLLGYPSSLELVGKPLSEVLVADSSQTSTAGQTEARYRRKNGIEIPVVVCRASMRLEDGTKARVCVARDTTRQKALEAELHLSQKLEAVSRLSAGVAHEFNNLLTVISGSANMMVQEPSLSDEFERDLRAIITAGGRAESITRQLLTFSRRQVVQPRSLDIGEVIGSSRPMLEQLLNDNIELDIQCNVSASFSADPLRIEQLLANLVTNARDAMPDGGSISIVAERVEPPAGSLSGPGHIRLRVADTGSGMDAGTKARMFEPFFTQKPSGKGTGLGLSIVQDIMDETQGRLVVESRVGAGTAIELHFPITEKEEVQPKLRPAASKSNSETVMVVEDDDTIRPLVVRILRRRKYEVLVADGLEQARELMTNHAAAIHLILTDVVLRRGTGHDVAVIAATARPETKILYMSGYTGDALIQHGVSTSDAEFLAKPFTPDGLAKKVQAILAR